LKLIFDGTKKRLLKGIQEGGKVEDLKCRGEEAIRNVAEIPSPPRPHSPHLQRLTHGCEIRKRILAQAGNAGGLPHSKCD